MLNHQLNSSPIFTERAFPGEKTALLLSILCRNGETALWVAPFLAELLRNRPDMAGRVALHLPAPAPATVTPEAARCFRSLAHLQKEEALTLWSGGWSGAPGAFLLSRELEEELLRADRNEEALGLAQLFPLPPEMFFLRGLSPPQAEELSKRTGTALCGGYRQQPRPGGVAPLWFFTGSRWVWRPSLVLDAEPPLAESFPSGSGEAGLPLIHLLIGPDASPDGLPAPDRIVQTLLPFLDHVLPENLSKGLPSENVAPKAPEPAPRTEGTGSDPGKDGLLPPFFADPLPLSTPRDFSLAAGTATPWRTSPDQRPRHPDKVLRTLSPYRETLRPAGKTGSIPPQHLPPGDFQSTTEGHLMMEEDSLTFKFASGRLAGIAWGKNTPEAGLTTVPRRAQGFFLDTTRRRPAVAYLQTRHAAWFSGESARGVEEIANLDCASGSLELHTSASLITGIPGLTLSFRARFPETLPEAPCSIRLFQIPLRYVSGSASTGDTSLSAEVITPDGGSLALNLSPKPGRITVAAWFLRIPISREQSLLIGTAEPGVRIATAFEIEIIRTPQGLLLAVEPIFRHDGILPQDLAGTSLAGTILLARGDTPLETLVIPSSEKTPLYRFSRTVPE